MKAQFYSGLLVLGILAVLGSTPAEARKQRKARDPNPTQKFPKDETPNNGEISGVISCYKPCERGERGCNSNMEGKDEVARPQYCPGMRPSQNNIHTSAMAKENGFYIVAASGTFRKQVGLGARISIDGIPGIGLVCDLCPGCDRHGKIVDVASGKNSDRKDCTSVPKGRLKIKVLSSALAPGKRD